MRTPIALFSRIRQSHNRALIQNFSLPRLNGTIRYFNSSKYRAFHRTLNLWGFAAVHSGPLQGCLWHPSFKRGRPDLVQRIHRSERAVKRKGSPQKKPSQAQVADGGDKKPAHRNQLASNDKDGLSSRLDGIARSSDQGQQSSHSVNPTLLGSQRDLAVGAIPSLLGARMASTDALGVPRSQSTLPLLQQLLAEKQINILRGEVPGRPVLNPGDVKQQTLRVGIPVRESISQQVHPGTSPNPHLTSNLILQQMLNASQSNTCHPYQGVSTPQNPGFLLREQLLKANNSMLQLNPHADTNLFLSERVPHQQRLKSNPTNQANQATTQFQNEDQSGRGFWGGTDIKGALKLPHEDIQHQFQKSLQQKGENELGVTSRQRPTMPPSALFDDRKRSPGDLIGASQNDPHNVASQLLLQLLNTPSSESTNRVGEVQRNANQLLLQLLGQQSGASQPTRIPAYQNSVLYPPTAITNLMSSATQPTGAVASDQVVPEFLRARHAGMGSFGDIDVTSPSSTNSSVGRFQQPFQQSSNNLATHLAQLQSRDVSASVLNDNLIRSRQPPTSRPATTSTWSASTVNQLETLLRGGNTGRQEVSDEMLMALLQTLQNSAATRTKGGHDDC